MSSLEPLSTLPPTLSAFPAGSSFAPPAITDTSDERTQGTQNPSAYMAHFGFNQLPGELLRRVVYAQPI